MCDEWWEPGLNETRILFMYRRYDAICHLLGSMAEAGELTASLSGERDGLMDDIAAQFLPRTALDFAAQTVVLARRGLIEVAPGEVLACVALLNRYVESLDNRAVVAGLEGTSGIAAWHNFKDLCLTATLPHRAVA